MVSGAHMSQGSGLDAPADAGRPVPLADAGLPICRLFAIFRIVDAARWRHQVGTSRAFPGTATPPSVVFTQRKPHVNIQVPLWSAFVCVAARNCLRKDFGADRDRRRPDVSGERVTQGGEDANAPPGGGSHAHRGGAGQQRVHEPRARVPRCRPLQPGHPLLPLADPLVQRRVPGGERDELALRRD